MMVVSTMAALFAWLAFIWIVDPDGFRARSRLAADRRRKRIEPTSESLSRADQISRGCTAKRRRGVSYLSDLTQ